MGKEDDWLQRALGNAHQETTARAKEEVAAAAASEKEAFDREFAERLAQMKRDRERRERQARVKKVLEEDMVHVLGDNPQRLLHKINVDIWDGAGTVSEAFSTQYAFSYGSKAASAYALRYQLLFPYKGYHFNERVTSSRVHYDDSGGSETEVLATERTTSRADLVCAYTLDAVRHPSLTTSLYVTFGLRDMSDWNQSHVGNVELSPLIRNLVPAQSYPTILAATQEELAKSVYWQQTVRDGAYLPQHIARTAKRDARDFRRNK